MRPKSEKPARGQLNVRWDSGLPIDFTDCCAASVLTLAMSLSCGHAYAQSSESVAANVQTTSSQNFTSSGSGSSLETDQPIPLSNSGAPVPTAVPNAAYPPTMATPSSAAPHDPYAKYEWKGLIVNLPPPPDTVDGNLFGYRQKLADDYGIGYYGLSSDTFYDNVLRHDHHGPQSYIGQKPTSFLENVFVLTFDLSRYGIPDGQIVAGTSYFASSWNTIAPTEINLGQLSYYQTLFNKRLEVKVGLLGNIFEYLGEFTGGSLAGGVFGPSGQPLLEAGGSVVAFPTYGINVTAHITRSVYDKFGIARGVTPLGIVDEHNFNPTGTRFSTPRTGAWVINEAGYLHPAEPGAPETWVRAGGVFSGSRYTELDHPELTSNRNYFLYLLADRQLWQISSEPDQAYRGLYAGFSAEYLPPNLNFFAEYYEVRLYGLGLLPHRPFDQVSVVATDTFFSSFAYSEARSAQQMAHSDSKAITGSYSFHLLPGFYVSAALQYINHPTPLTYTSSSGSALNVISGVTLFF